MAIVSSLEPVSLPLSTRAPPRAFRPPQSGDPMYACATMSERRTFAAPYRPGDVLAGRYELRSMLDQGGASEVYLGYDRLLEREVVIKAPRAGLLSDPKLPARFRREARALARLSHPA